MKRIIKVILLILLLFILPIIVPVIVLLTGIINTVLVIGCISLLTICSAIMFFKKDKKGLVAYSLILGIVIGYSAYQIINLNNIILEGKNLSFSERVKRYEDIISGKYTIEELTVKHIRDKRRSKYDLKIVKGQRTFYYKNDLPNPEKSIEFIDDTLNKTMEYYAKYLGYFKEEPSEFFLTSLIGNDLRGQVDAANQIEIGIYHDYTDGGKFSDGGLEEYRKIIIHEYAHFIQGTYVRNDEDFVLTPSWFNEGVATYVANEICNIKDERGEINPIDLSKKLSESGNRYPDYYISSARVIREIYNEVGSDGVIRILKLSTKLDFDKALKDVTGKQLEDYYYIFKG